MTNWNEPATIDSQYAEFVDLQHVIAGVYFWEFVAHLAFDWRLIRCQRKFSWTPWLYITSRISGVAALVTILTGNDINQYKINCTLWLAFCYIFSYIAQWLSSALIGIRVIAIWDGSVFVNTFVALMMLGLAGTFLHVIVLAKGDWDFTKPACSILESADNLPNTAGALIVDAVFLFVMLVGLLRRREARLFGLWPLLWKQGIIWLFLAIIAEVPAVTFVALNFNTPMNMMFLAPQVVILLIGATRMYRSLTNFFEPSRNKHAIQASTSHPHTRYQAAQDIGRKDPGTIIAPLAVSIHRVQEEYLDIPSSGSRELPVKVTTRAG